MRPAALLLDLDGTLVDTEPMNRVAYSTYFRSRGWDVPDLSLFVGRRAADVFTTVPGPWTGEDPVALSTAILALIDPDAVPDHLPGAAELLALDIPTAIVTSADVAWVRRAAVGEVDVLVTAEDVVDGKPDPTGFRLACERLGVDPRTALAVEDSPAGVRAAVAAGVGQVVAVTTTHDAAELRAAGTDHVVDDLHAVLGLVETG